MHTKIIHHFRSPSISLLPKRGVFDEASGFNTGQKKQEAEAIKERIVGKNVAPGAPVEGKVKKILDDLKDIQTKVSTLGDNVKKKFIEYIKKLKVKNKDGGDILITAPSDEKPENLQKAVNALLEKITDDAIDKNSEILRTLDRDLDGVFLRVKIRQVMAEELKKAFSEDKHSVERDRIGTLLEEQMGKTYENSSGSGVREGEIGSEFGITDAQIKERIEVLHEMQKYAHMVAICEKNGWNGNETDGKLNAGLIVDHGIAYPQEVGGVAWFNYWVENQSGNKVIYAIDNVYGRVQKYDPKGKGAGKDAWVWVDDKKGHDASHADDRFANLDAPKLKQYKDQVEASIGTGDEKVRNLEKLLKAMMYERMFISSESREYKDVGGHGAMVYEGLTAQFKKFQEKHGKKYVDTVGKAGSMNFSALQFFEGFENGEYKKFAFTAALPNFRLRDTTTMPAGAPKAPDKDKDKDKAKPDLITKWDEIVEGLKSDVLPWGDVKFNPTDKHKICRMKQEKPSSTFDIDRAEINDTIANKAIFNVKNGNLMIDATAVNREVAFKKCQKIDLWIQEKDGAKKIGKKKLLTLIIGEALTFKTFELPIRLAEDAEWDKSTKLYIAHQGKFAADSKFLELEALPPGVSVEITNHDGTALDVREYSKTADGTITTVKVRVPQTEAKFKLKFMKGPTELYKEDITVQVGYPKLRDDDVKFNLIAPKLERGSIVNNTWFYVGKLSAAREGVEHEISVQVRSTNGKVRDGGRLTYDTATKYYKYNTNSQLEIGETLVLTPKAILKDDPSQTKNGTAMEIAIQKERTNPEDLRPSRTEIEVDSTTLDLNAAGVSPFELFQISGFHMEDFQPGATLTATYNGVTYVIQRNLFEGGSKVFLVKDTALGAVNSPLVIDKDAPKDLIVMYKAKKRSDNSDFTKEFKIILKAKDYKIGEEAAQLENGARELVLEEGDLSAGAKVASLKDTAEVDGLQTRTVKEITGGADANGRNISTLLELVGNDIKVKVGQTIKPPAGGIEASITLNGTDKFGRVISGLDNFPIKIRLMPKPESKPEHFSLKDAATAFVTRSINAPDDIAEFNEVPDSLGKSVTAKVFEYNNVEKTPPVNLGLSFTGPKKNILKLDSGSVENGIVELTVKIGSKEEKLRLFINPSENDRKMLAGGEKIDGITTLVDQYAKALSIKNFSVLQGTTPNTWEIVNDGFVTTVKKVGENLEIEEIAGTKMTFSGADVPLAYYCALQLNKIVASNKGKKFKTDGNKIGIQETDVLGIFPRPSWLVADDISIFPVSVSGAAQNFVNLLNARAEKVNAKATEVIKLPEDKEEKFTVIRDLPISSLPSTGDVKYSIDEGKNWLPVLGASLAILKADIAKNTNADKKLVVWIKGSESGKIGTEKRYEYEIVPAYNKFEVSDDKSKLILKHSDSTINNMTLNYTFSIASNLPGFKFDSIDGKYIKIFFVETGSVVPYGKLHIDEMTGNIESAITDLATGKTAYTFIADSNPSMTDREIMVTR